MTDSIIQSNTSPVTTRLIELINNISETQRRALLGMLEDWQNTKRRDHPRKPCLMAVDYAAEDRVFKDFIHNISSGGVFVETNESFSVGQDITMTFSLPHYEEPVKITGEIVWSAPHGIGVKFKTPHQHLDAMIQSI